MICSPSSSLNVLLLVSLLIKVSHSYYDSPYPTAAAAQQHQREQQSIPTITNRYDLVCDERKCISSGRYGGYDCWALGPDTIDPFLCSDGYIGYPIVSVEPIMTTTGVVANSNSNSSTLTVANEFYYTCCLPSSFFITGNINKDTTNNSIDIDEDSTESTTTQSKTQQHTPATANNYPAAGEIIVLYPECSPSWDACNDVGGDCFGDGPYDPMSCKDELYKYPNKNGYTIFYNSWNYSQYQCCQTKDPSYHSTIFLPEVFRCVFGGIGFMCSMSLLLGIGLDWRARTKPFNVYIVFLILSDTIGYNLVSIIVPGMILSGNYRLENSCFLIHFFKYFCLGTNSWLYVIITYELAILLQKSKQNKTFYPPTLSKVYFQMLCVYLCVIGVSACAARFLFCNDHDTLPTNTMNNNNYPLSEEDTKFFPNPKSIVLVFLVESFLIFVPLLYLFYMIGIKVLGCCFYHSNTNNNNNSNSTNSSNISNNDNNNNNNNNAILPRTGRNRHLAVYMFRLILLYVFFLIPILVLEYLIMPIMPLYNNFIGIHYFISYLNNIQSIVQSVLAIVLKPDIRRCVANLWTCQCNNRNSRRKSKQSHMKGDNSNNDGNNGGNFSSCNPLDLSNDRRPPPSSLLSFGWGRSFSALFLINMNASSNNNNYDYNCGGQQHDPEYSETMEPSHPTQELHP